MDDDDYPNFGSAFPTAAPAITPSTEAEPTASWHPALRKDSDPEAEEDDDFYSRYPGATPKKQQQQDTSIITDADDDEEVAEFPARRISIQHDVHVQRHDATEEDMTRAPSNHVTVEGPISRDGDDEDEEAAILNPEKTAREQEAALETEMPDHELEIEDEQPIPVDEEDAEHYEHQGEATEMEEAQEPSPDAPLLPNEEPTPTSSTRQSTMDVASRQPTLGLQDTRQSQPPLNRSFTTNFSDSPIEPAPVQSQSIPDEWPSMGDDRVFGEILGDEEVQGDEQQTDGADKTFDDALRNEQEQPQVNEKAIVDDDLLPDDDLEEPTEADLAAAWDAALDDDDMLEETPTDLDPSQFFDDDDDDGFLEDEPDMPPPTQPAKPQPKTASYRPATLQPSQQPQTLVGIPSPQFFQAGGVHGRSAETPSTGFSAADLSHYQQPAPPQRPQGIQHAQSFADKAKGGYQSPYDLPMDVVKPQRRRPQVQQAPAPVPAPTPPVPPRSSSFGASQMVSPPPSRGAGATPAAVPGGTKGASGFFEELPMTAKPRARPVAGPQAPMTPPVQQQPTPPGLMSPPPPPQQPQPGDFRGLRQPERLPLLPDQVQQQQTPSQAYQPMGAQQQQQQRAPLPQQNRYSPAPTQPAGQTAPPPPPTSRYSPAPASTGPSQAKSRQASLPFAPRTSSPLAAHTDKPHPSLPPEAQAQFQRGPPSSPPKANGVRSPPESIATQTSPHKYSPVETRTIDQSMNFGPPLRARTGSPETAMKSVPTMNKTARPGSAGMAAAPQPAQRGPVLPHRRQFSRDLTFATPTDERSVDPLQRWKGHPIFRWSPGGTVLHSFPKHTPFYAAGQAGPNVKCTPGSISVFQDAGQFMAMPERDAKFPGPLGARSKGRKKEVVAWMAGKIEDLEREAESARMDFTRDDELKKRAEEKVVLWKVMKIFVENDGSLDAGKGDEEVRKILLPNLAQMAQVADLQSPHASNSVMSEPVDRQILFQLRQALLEGHRERAVWLAEEKKLWGHAMLIASTMGPDVWKQIVQAFVRSQVKSVGSDARSMAALYQVFAGNSEECVDELVPPSARAGFRMISKSDGSVSGNPLEGLDQWRETLGLVTGNRTGNDGPSLVSLGKLLASYGRVEAAHTCFLFARALVKHSGADDADAHFVLLGASKDDNDRDAIMLTEIYEYATSLSAPSTAAAYIPHLQAYKLLHAQELAAFGLKSRAQSYCEMITSAYTSTTRPSPYYHPTFTQAVADLGAFLAQTPHDGKKGLLSRPAMNKVSSNAASWFTKFVAGEDDAQSTGSGQGGGSEGPFGGVNGDSGTISRSGSSAELYNPMMGGNISAPQLQQHQQTFAASSAPSRYAPGGSASTSTSRPPIAQAYSSPNFPAAEPQRPGSSRYAPPPSSLGVPYQANLNRRASDYSIASSRRGSAQDTSSQGSYEPRPILADEVSAYSYSPPVHSPMMNAHSPPVHSPLVLAQKVEEDHGDAFDAPEPQPLNPVEDDAFDPETGGGYMPPTAGYEPPSYGYQPYEPEPDSPEESKPKKKTFGDDEDDDAMARQAASLKKSQADREADDAFRKAAEADAQRDKLSADQKKAGWFGGWFAGKKGDGLGATPAGPIKAKLGEENSFYYDEDLKKWVNKKGGAEAATPVAATPPPPRGPASRVASSTMGPPSGPPSRNSSGSGLANMTRPPTSGSGPAFSGPPSGPPSRVATPASNPSSDHEGTAPPTLVAPPSLNGLVGAAAARPSSSLSNASSIDDLLGGPPGAGQRKAGGTVKSKKKGGRYVDVMAK